MAVKKHTSRASRARADAYRDGQSAARKGREATLRLRRLRPLIPAAALLGLAGCVSARDCLAGASQVQALECQASRGDKAAQLALAERLETGDGMAADPARAARLYRQAGDFTSGMAFIYVPGVDKKPGFVMPLRKGPDQAGLPEAQYRLGLMYLEGRGVRPDRDRGLSLLRRAAKAGSAQAAAKLESMGEPR